MNPSETVEVEGHVTNILNEIQLVVSVGSNHGVEKDSLVGIYSPTPIRVVDPYTMDELGTFTQRKVTVRVVAVFDRFSVCETYQTRTVRTSSMPSVFAGGLFDRSQQGGATVLRQTLRADDEIYPSPLDEKDSFVKIGDKAVLLPPTKERNS